MLRTPCKVARFKAQCTIFEIAAPNTDGVYAFSSELSVGGLTTELEFSFFAVMSTLGTGRRALVP
jgi:hypothetical protein